MVKREATLLLVLAILVLFEVAAVSASADVAYIYRKSFRIDNNILRVFNESNITYDLINEKNLPINFAQYKLIFVGDENFRYPNRILVNQFPSVVANYYHANYWGLTDAEGVSQLGADHPLEVKKDGRMIQVYTAGREWPGGPSVVYYFLDETNKAPGLQTIALTESTQSGDMFGDVISKAPAGTPLFSGKTQQSRLCFYGIVDSDYWTPAAKDLLKECLGYVGAECNANSDCPAPQYSAGFCQSGNVYRNVTQYTCQINGFFKKCVPNQTIEIVEDCPYDCLNGACIGECQNNSDCGTSGPLDGLFCIGKNITQTFEQFTCAQAGTPNAHCVHEIFNQTQQTCGDVCINATCQNITCSSNSDCNDQNSSTQDTCHNPGTVQSYCTNEPIRCFTNSDCGIDGFSGNQFCIGKNVTRLFDSFTCHNQGTPQSFCNSTREQRILQQCADLCTNGACQEVACYRNSDCNDQNSSTYDECLNPGQVSSECRNTPINCASNSDCGFTGFLGQEFCSGQNIVKKFQNATCFNPGTTQSYCTVIQLDKTLEHCDSICSNGQCFNTACDSNSDCTDNNPLTYDECLHPGTTISECRNTPINCAIDSDCGYTGYLGDEFCSSDKNVSKNFQTADCVNAGQLHAYCDLSVEQQFINQCDFACYDGTCIRCDSNSDCNDNNPQTADLCQNPGTLSSYCTNEPISGGNITCRQNSDCGTSGSIGSPFCSGASNVSRLFQNWICNNAGTTQSYCSSNIITQISQNCQGLCLNGQCVDIRCFNNQDCNDQNSSTTDICVNPGVVQSYCTNEPTHANITCSRDSDCGVNSPISPLFCSGNAISQLTRTWSCNNPGTPQSYCSSNTIINLVQNCQNYCSNGACVNIRCFNNQDCNDNSSQTLDLCNNPGTPQSYCTNNPLEITCSHDSDCGADGFVGDPFCSANNLTRLFQEFDCNNPGTPQSYCSTSASEVTVEQCAHLCSNGQCTPEEGECIPGQIRTCGSNLGECSAGINVCYTDATWSAECFGEVSPAAEICDGLDNNCNGQTDEGNVCGGSCTDECSQSGQRTCSNNGYKVCGDFDSDSCLDWSQTNACSYGQTCNNGYCNQTQPTCQDECSYGSRTCDGNNYKVCGDYDADPCAEWSQTTLCSYGQICSSGQCITPSPTCQNECSQSGQRTCSNNDYQICGNYDSDSCLELSQVTACSYGEVCQSGYCNPTCQDECSYGSRTCDGNNYKVCGDYDADPCAEWSQTNACSYGQICSSGQCITPSPTCQNECSQSGQRTCSNNDYQICGNYDSDSCLELSQVTACSYGEVCQSGYCNPTCQDECSYGSRTCDGNNYKVCGDYDADPCAEWSQTNACSYGQTCNNGYCI